MIVINQPKFNKEAMLKWLTKCYKEMCEDEDNCTTYTYNIDDRLCLHLVWRDGFSEEDTPHKNGWMPCLGIAIRDSSYFTEDWTVIPEWEDTSIHNEDDIEHSLEYILDTYYQVYRYDWTDEGDVHYKSFEEANHIVCPFCGCDDNLHVDYDATYVSEAYTVVIFRSGYCKDCERYFDVGESHVRERGCIGIRESFGKNKYYKGTEIK